MARKYTTMIANANPGNERWFVIEVSNSDPAAGRHGAPDILVDREVHLARAKTRQRARFHLRRGLWVEVYDRDTQELLAGPLDPDQIEPVYIV